MRNHPLGIYEKRWRKDLSGRSGWCWQKAVALILSKCRWMKPTNGSSRLDWSAAQRASLVTAMIETGVAIPSMCLSAHRRFPFGSRTRQCANGRGKS